MTTPSSRYVGNRLLALAADANNRLAITESGGIGPLVALLGCVDNAQARAHAEGALVRLSIETANRVLIIKQLVSMLISDGSTAAALKSAQEAAVALKKETEKAVADKKAAEERGASTSLNKRYELEVAAKQAAADEAKAELLECTRRVTEEEAAQEQAAAALANLARESTDNRTSIVESGGIPALLELMRTCSSQGCKENTIRAIIALATRSRPNQEATASAGGIPILVHCIASAGKSQETLAECSLAAEALWRLSEDHAANKVSTCMKHMHEASPAGITHTGLTQSENCLDMKYKFRLVTERYLRGV